MTTTAKTFRDPTRAAPAEQAGLGLGSTALFRLVSLGLGFVVNLFAIGVLAREFGAAEYGLYALIASIIFLLPFADLGLGAGVINATTDHRSGELSDPGYRSVLSRTQAVLVGLAVLLVVISVLLLAAGWWPALLGGTAGVARVGWAATYTLACVGIVLPLGMGARILQGRGRMQTVVRLSLVGPAVQAAVVGGCLLAGADAWLFLCAPATAYLVVGLVTYAYARATSTVRPVLSRGLLLRPDPAGPTLARTALPFFVITVGLALGVQSQRLILAHVGTIEQVAQFSFVAQFTGPSISVLTVMGQNLWPRYRARLADGRLSVATYGRHVLLFAGCGLVAGVGVVVAVPLLSRFVLAGTVTLPPLLLVAAGGYLVIMGLHQPGAMMLTDPRGLWWQAVLVVTTAVASVATAVLAIGAFGAAGPYLALGACLLVLQAGPTIRLATLRITRSARLQVPSSTPTTVVP